MNRMFATINSTSEPEPAPRKKPPKKAAAPAKKPPKKAAAPAKNDANKKRLTV